MDDDLEARFRQADHAVTAIGTGPTLRELAVVDAVTRSPRRVSPSGLSRRWVALPVLGALAVVITMLIQVLTPIANPAYAATPSLLEGRGDRLSIQKVSAMAESLLAGEPANERGAIFEAWYVNTDVDSDGRATSYVSPQVVVRRWSADLSGSIEIAAGSPYKSESRADSGPKPPKEGTVLDSRAFAAGEIDILFIDEPPSDVESLRVYLASTGRDISDPAELIESITELRNEWTLGTKTEAAVLALVAQAPGVEPMGLVTDRLGREGWGFSVDSTTSSSWRGVFVISNKTGEILSTERVYLGGIPDFDLPSPAVVSYTAWK